MFKQRIFVVFFVLASLIFFLNTVSAQNLTLVGGKIYTNGFKDIVEGAQVKAECNSNILETASLKDGSYAVGFAPEKCAKDSTVQVSAASGNLFGSGNGIVVECTNSTICNTDLFAIINPNLKVKETGGSGGGGGGGSSGGFYLCGNNKCDSGETIKTCPKDCTPVNKTETPSSKETQSNQENISLRSENPETANEQTGSFGISRITGAVIGALKSPPLVFIIVALIVIFAASLVVRLKRKKPESK